MRLAVDDPEHPRRRGRSPPSSSQLDATWGTTCLTCSLAVGGGTAAVANIRISAAADRAVTNVMAIKPWQRPVVPM
jgi:hypothetical protein